MAFIFRKQVMVWRFSTESDVSRRVGYRRDMLPEEIGGAGFSIKEAS